MILESFDKSGSVVVGQAPDVALIARTIQSVNWHVDDIVGVVLVHDSHNWADGCGNFAHGFSLMLEDNGVQHVSKSAPTTIEAIIEFLIAYRNGDSERVYEILYDKHMPMHEIDTMIGDWCSTAQAETLPLLSKNTPTSCPATKENICRYLSAEEGETIERYRLRFVRTARIERSSYWLWRYECRGRECFAIVLKARYLWFLPTYHLGCWTNVEKQSVEDILTEYHKMMNERRVKYYRW